MTITRSATPATTPRSWVMSTIAELGAVLDALEHVEHLGLDRHVERGRGLVGDEQVGVVRDRHRDHRPLAHAARVLVRVLLGPVGRVRDADEVEQLDHALLQLLAADLAVDRDRLRDLVADPVRRVQRREGVLEHHRDPRRPGSSGAPSPRAPAGPGPRTGCDPVTCARLGSSPSIGHRRDRLPRSRLPHDPQRLARHHRERDVVDRVERAVVGGERDRQPLHREERLGGRAGRHVGSPR